MPLCECLVGSTCHPLSNFESSGRNDLSELVLHIGTKKTGTTFIQRYLNANSAKLQKQGWQYPAFVDNANHLRYAVPFQKTITKEHRQRGIVDDASRAEFIEAIDAELAAHVKPDHRWIMSSEHFSSRLQTREEVEQAVGLLRRHFDQITVVVMFRRQEFMFPSIYSQTIKDGGSAAWSWEFCEARLSELDYAAMLARWTDAVGAANIRAKPYLEARKGGDEFLRDFGALTGISFGVDWVKPRDLAANQSLNAEGIAFMRVVNPYIPFLRADDSPNYGLRQAAITEVMKLTTGPGFRPGPEVIDKITDSYAATNADFVQSLGSTEQWREWLDQPIHSGRPPVDVPDISAERVAALMVQLAEPNGPVAWGRPAGRPLRLQEMAAVVGRRSLEKVSPKGIGKRKRSQK